MNLMEAMQSRASADLQRVAFTEADDETMMRAVGDISQRHLAQCILIGNTSELTAQAKGLGIDTQYLTFDEIDDESRDAELIAQYRKLPWCMFSEKALKRRLRKPLERALIREAVGEIDATFAGITSTTGDVILAGQTIIGLADSIQTPSSVGIFDIPGYEGPEGTLLAFGDSAVCLNPTSEELASIAISACDTVHALTGWEPRCALLSYSTDGSGEGELVDKVVHARELANSLRPDLHIDGEFQLDTALSPRTAARKVHRPSEVAGRANIIIWPDLNAGNIGVKLVQQFAHANAYGPMLQGFRKIVCDCSRSSPAEEIVGNVVMSCVRAQALQGGAA